MLADDALAGRLEVLMIDDVRVGRQRGLRHFRKLPRGSEARDLVQADALAAGLAGHIGELDLTGLVVPTDDRHLIDDHPGLLADDGDRDGARLIHGERVHNRAPPADMSLHALADAIDLHEERILVAGGRVVPEEQRVVAGFEIEAADGEGVGAQRHRDASGRLLICHREDPAGLTPVLDLYLQQHVFLGDVGGNRAAG